MQFNDSAIIRTKNQVYLEDLYYTPRYPQICSPNYNNLLKNKQVATTILKKKKKVDIVTVSISIVLNLTTTKSLFHLVIYCP